MAVSNGDIYCWPPRENCSNDEISLEDLFSWPSLTDEVAPCALFQGSSWPHGNDNYGLSYQNSSYQFTNSNAISHPIPLTSNNFSSSVHVNQNEINFKTNHTVSPPELNPSVEKPLDDGYNWRKYGQKQLKDGKYPKSYYRCTNQNCTVKKTIERSSGGYITDITYQGKHDHQSLREIQTREDEIELSLNKSDQEDISEVLTDGDDSESVENEGSSSNGKKRKEPRIIFETRSDIDLLDDGYRWRKYGQKSVKGNSHPRSYYKCTYPKCNVRKQIERASKDSRTVLTTYEGKHTHDLPPVNARLANCTNNTMEQTHAQFGVNNISMISVKRDPSYDQ